MRSLSLDPVPLWAENLWDLKARYHGFVRQPHPLIGDYIWIDTRRKLTVICSASIEKDGKRWMHISCSRPSGLPSWYDLKRVKETFIGNRKAIQVFPKEEEYVNVYNVLHLWSCLDDDGLPDFRKNGTI